MDDAEPRRHAVVAVLRHDDQVLVIRRGPQARNSGFWAPLSGRIEPGESEPAALVREVREEVGLDVTPAAKVWECDTDDGGFRLHWWTAEADPGPLVLDPGEVSEARWVTVKEFLALEPTFAGDRDFFVRVFPRLAEQDGSTGPPGVESPGEN
jgi:8-oxo-dGTP diphosphatase